MADARACFERLMGEYMQPPNLDRARRSWLAVLALVAALGVVEGLAALAAVAAGPYLDEPIRRVASIYREQTKQIRLLLADADTTARREQVDSVLGWRYLPGFRSATDSISAQGLRGNREYAAVPARGVTRVAAFGDSFVYGNEVSNDDVWTLMLEQQWPAVEVLNYGVGGYGNDQALLRYDLEGAMLQPHIVLLGFVPDDLRRTVNVYRRFLSTKEPPLFKPRFLLVDGGGLQLLSNPVPALEDYRRYLENPARVREVGAHDYWYEGLIYANPLYDWSATTRLASAVWIRLKRRYLDKGRLERAGVFNERSEPFRIQLELFREFASRVRRNGAKPVIVFFPDAEAAERYRAGRRVSYAPLFAAARAQGLEVLDLAPGFAEAATGRPLHAFFMSGGHYSPLGNAVVAEWVGRHLLATPGPVSSSPQ